MDHAEFAALMEFGEVTPAHLAAHIEATVATKHARARELGWKSPVDMTPHADAPKPAPERPPFTIVTE